MCCSTGVCGPHVDPQLPRFAADLEWLRNQGLEVARYNLAQQPRVFVETETVKQTSAQDRPLLPGRAGCRNAEVLLIRASKLAAAVFFLPR